MSKSGKSKAGDAPRDGTGDPRFAMFRTDPLYRLPSKKSTRVTVDSRFSRMFSDPAFSSKAKVDRYGRRLPKAKSAAKSRRELERLYRLEERESKEEKARAGRVGEEKGEGEEEEEDDEDGGVAIAVERADKKDQKGPAYDPARMGGFSESSSEEDESDEESDEEEDEETLTEDVEDSGLASARQDQDDVPEGEVSRRLAVVNLDWDNIRAIDLFAVLNSFATKGGRIEKVTVYPSEFGKTRLAREEVEGPPKELFAVKNSARKDMAEDEDDDSEADEEEDPAEEEDEEEEDERIRKSIVQEDTGEDFDSAQLRKYQLERLQYYYGVVECSSEQTAKGIYDAVDGMEYLSTANFFDLRFIPDETDFSTDKPRDTCKEVPVGYKPNEFSTHALQHSKVKLTWDADDTNRKEAQKRAFSRAEIDENDLKAYLASDSSDDQFEEEPEVVDATEVTTQQADAAEEVQDGDAKLSKKELARKKMRERLGLPAEPAAASKSKKNEPVGDMQITFTTAFSGGDGGPVFENEPIGDETTIERYVRRERERKARRKEKMKAARSGADGGAAEGEDGEEGADAAGQGARAEKEEEDLGFDDPFFTGADGAETASKKKKNPSKEEKRQKRLAKEAEEARAAEERAALVHLVGDEDDVGGKGVRHFDMHDLKKAEKTLRKTKGSKRAKLKQGERAAIQAKQADDFAMDVADPRFAARLDQPAFAIDTSHPSFDKTEGMQALLEERRRKRAREAAEEDGNDEHGNGGERGKKQKHRQDKSSSSPAGKGADDDGDDLKNLVRRLKGNAKR